MVIVGSWGKSPYC